MVTMFLLFPGDGSASESQELKSELETLKQTLADKSLDIASQHAKVLLLERELSAAVQGSESGAAEREKQLTQSLAQQKTAEDELLMARQELKSIRMSVRVKVEEEAEERWRGVLKGEQQLAKKNADAAAQKLEELTAELGKKLNDSQAEAAKWKTQAADFQSTAADKLAESSLLKREIEVRDPISCLFRCCSCYVYANLWFAALTRWLACCVLAVWQRDHIHCLHEVATRGCN